MKLVRQKIQHFFNMSRPEREMYNADIGKVIEEFRHDYDQVTLVLNGLIHKMTINNNGIK